MTKIRGINKIVTGIPLLFFPPLLYFVRIIIARPLKINEFVSFDVLGNVYLPFDYHYIA